MLLAAVAGAHTAYYAVPDGSPDRAWVQWVGMHVLLLVLLAMQLPEAISHTSNALAVLGGMACWWGIIETAQSVGCSLLMWGTLSQADLCEQAFGRGIYAVAAALAAAGVIERVLHGRAK